MAKNREVDDWFARYENPMKPVVERVRAIVLGADARIEECIKWQAPTFTYLGNLASFFPKSKQHASLMFHEGASIPGKHPRLEGSGDKGRVMKFATVAEVNAARADIVRVVKAWCDLRELGANTPSRKSAVAKAAKPVLRKAPKLASARKASKPAARPVTKKTAAKKAAAKKRNG